MLDEVDFVGEKPYKEAYEFGFEESVFLLNAGEMLSQLIAMLMILPVALLLQQIRNHKIAGYFFDIVRSYRWGFFIRGWIEIYIELLCAATLQSLAPSYDNSTLTANTVLGYSFLCLLSLTPLIVTVFLIL